jgi:hypothetical protein
MQLRILLYCSLAIDSRGEGDEPDIERLGISISSMKNPIVWNINPYPSTYQHSLRGITYGVPSANSAKFPTSIFRNGTPHRLNSPSKTSLFFITGTN